jgi:3-carboxy-cis,cis-muconate cycloisomerase
VRTQVAVLAAGEHEHERAAGAWHAEWGALAEALALTGGAAAAIRESLEGLEVHPERMRANMTDALYSERNAFGLEGDYFGSVDAFVERALERWRG